jgi:hypothetical protein
MQSVTLPVGAIIPKGAAVSTSKFVGGPITANTRPTLPNGQEGAIWAAAPMLPQGDLSWSLQFVSGADLSAANTQVLQPQAVLGQGGNLTLNDPHFGGAAFNGPSFSVLRTGTGDLDLLAGGNFIENTPYGIYTAGTQLTVDSAYLLPRGLASDGSGTVLGSGQTGYENAIADYQAYYPTGGGDVLVSVQGNLSGNSSSSNGIGNWLWRQGGGIANQSTAWWINFGTYTPGAVLTGFTGIGALGGGNVGIYVGGNVNASSASQSNGFAVAVGGSGRVLADGTLMQTGGGDLTIKVGGLLNASNAVFTDLRGNISISAGQVGNVNPIYGGGAPFDLRSPDPLTAEQAIPTGGIVLAPGDGTATIDTRGDLVLGGAANPGLVNEQNMTPFTAAVNGVDTSFAGAGYSWFSLWTSSTAINLFSAGGNLTPGTQNETPNSNVNTNVGGVGVKQNYMYPASVNLIAASGSIYYPQNQSFSSPITVPIELAPSTNGQLNVLAKNSIYGLGIEMSGADPSSVATPFNPGFAEVVGLGNAALTNASPNSAFGNQSPQNELLAFGPDTPTSAVHANDPDPARIYAVTGDLFNLEFGEAVTLTDTRISQSAWYIGAKPVKIMAGRDIIYAGKPSAVGGFGYSTIPGFVLNLDPADVSVMSDGRDISYSSFQVGGPGVLDVEAGRNIYLPTVNFTNPSNGVVTPLGGVFTASDRCSV